MGPNFYKGGDLAHGGRWGDSPRGMHVVGTPDAEVGCGWHAALRVPVWEAADGAGLQGAGAVEEMRWPLETPPGQRVGKKYPGFSLPSSFLLLVPPLADPSKAG